METMKVETNGTQPNGRPKGRSRKERAGLVNSGASGSFELFSVLPPEAAWLRTGLVERQISATVWQSRKMILTAVEVLFVKADSDAIVDRLPISSVVFVGSVNLASATSQDAAKPKPKPVNNANSSLKRWGSLPNLLAGAGVPAPAADGAPGATGGGGGASAAPGADVHFAFEIRLSAAGDDGRGRSYFARVDAPDERDAWVAALLDAVRAEQSAGRSRATVLVWAQVDPPPPPRRPCPAQEIPPWPAQRRLAPLPAASTSRAGPRGGRTGGP
jgi:hypothetical protein